jgi:hypothetical protein
MPSVEFQCANGSVEIPAEHVNKFVAIKILMEDIVCDDAPEPIPLFLKNYDVHILTKLNEFLSATDKRDFIDKNSAYLKRLTKAAFALEVTEFMDEVSKKWVRIITNESVEVAREKLNLPKDLTTEEEQEIIKKTRFCKNIA